jgi:hypothetical protein
LTERVREETDAVAHVPSYENASVPAAVRPPIDTPLSVPEPATVKLVGLEIVRVAGRVASGPSDTAPEQVVVKDAAPVARVMARAEMERDASAPRPFAPALARAAAMSAVAGAKDHRGDAPEL